MKKKISPKKVALRILLIGILIFGYFVAELLFLPLMGVRMTITHPLYFSVALNNEPAIRFFSKFPYFRNQILDNYFFGNCAGTPLELALRQRKYNYAQILLENGSGMKSCRTLLTYTSTLLTYTIRDNNLSMTKLLVAHGADVFEKPDSAHYIIHAINADKCDGNSPSSEMMLYFINLGLDVNERQLYPNDKVPQNRPTPFIAAATKNCLNNAKVLVEHGADKNAKYFDKPLINYLQEDFFPEDSPMGQHRKLITKKPLGDYTEMLKFLTETSSNQ